jgi:hypothetical protein
MTTLSCKFLTLLQQFAEPKGKLRGKWRHLRKGRRGKALWKRICNLY